MAQGLVDDLRRWLFTPVIGVLARQVFPPAEVELRVHLLQLVLDVIAQAAGLLQPVGHHRVQAAVAQ